MNEKKYKEADLLGEAKKRVALLTEALLCAKINIDDISLTAKIPLKALIYRETLTWRTEELARTACEMYERNELISAVILTRACAENAAAIWFLKKKIQKVVDTKELLQIDDDLIKLIMGSKNNVTSFEAFNVLTFIKSVEKDLMPGFEKAYADLCEYAHPNWSGTSLLFSKSNPQDFCVDLGKYIRHRDNLALAGLLSFNNFLALFDLSFNQIADLLPDFIKICEAALKSKEETQEKV